MSCSDVSKRQQNVRGQVRQTLGTKFASVDIAWHDEPLYLHGYAHTDNVKIPH